MKISVISIGDKVTGTANTTVVLLSTFTVEGNDKLQLQVSENKDVFFPIQVHGPPEIYSRTPG
jgi:hypothetical protein